MPKKRSEVSPAVAALVIVLVLGGGAYFIFRTLYAPKPRFDPSHLRSLMAKPPPGVGGPPPGIGAKPSGK